MLLFLEVGLKMWIKIHHVVSIAFKKLLTTLTGVPKTFSKWSLLKNLTVYFTRYTSHKIYKILREYKGEMV